MRVERYGHMAMGYFVGMNFLFQNYMYAVFRRRLLSHEMVNNICIILIIYDCISHLPLICIWFAFHVIFCLLHILLTPFLSIYYGNYGIS